MTPTFGNSLIFWLSKNLSFLMAKLEQVIFSHKNDLTKQTEANSRGQEWLQ